MAAALSSMRKVLAIAVFVGLTGIGGVAADEPSADEILSPLQAARQSITGDDLFGKLLEHNRLRDLRL